MREIRTYGLTRGGWPVRLCTAGWGPLHQGNRGEAADLVRHDQARSCHTFRHRFATHRWRMAATFACQGSCQDAGSEGFGRQGSAVVERVKLRP